MFDQGFQNTAVVESQITFVDGTEGSIFYRGHPISELVGHKQFEDVAFLLIWGYMPTPEEREKFRRELAVAMSLPEMVSNVIQSFP